MPFLKVLLSLFLYIIPSFAGEQSLSESANNLTNVISSKMTEYKASENVFFSGFNVQNAFQLLYPGTNGATKQEMAKALGVDSLSDEEFYAQYSVLKAKLQKVATLPRWNEGKETKLKMGTQLWANKGNGFEFQPEYLKVAQEVFGATVESINFAAAEEERASVRGEEELLKGAPKDLVNSARGL